MDLGIDGKRALVMGASRGLGRAVAEAFVREGVITAICARDKARLESAARDIGAKPFPADLSKPGIAAQLVQDAAAALGGLDILVVNTGGPPPRTFDNIEDQDWRDAFEGLWMSAVAAIRAGAAGHARAPLGPHSRRHLDRRARADPQSHAVERPARGPAWSRQRAEQGVRRPGDHRRTR